MSVRKKFIEELEGRKSFLLGDEACAYGAIYAGCDFFAAYPITPASEIAEKMAEVLPQMGGKFIQMEDELGAISAVIGAVWAGAKGMTATSGPGFSLMQEGIGYGVMTETPFVVVDVQRSGPSTGQATKPSQGDVMQARWGTHGDHNIIALAPWSVEETFYLTVEAFNLAERYRTPVLVLSDGEIGHLREPFVFPKADDIEVENRFYGEPPFFGGGGLVPPMSKFGRGDFVHITGSTHKPNGLRDVETQSVHDELVRRLYDKIEKNREKIVKTNLDAQSGSKFGVISYGVSARPSYGAVLQARRKRIKVDFLRLVTLWPFPRNQVREFTKNLRAVLVVEENLGQMVREVERFAQCRVEFFGMIGGRTPSVSEIYSALKGMF
ncbi:MAG: 2-oxoacid:acceptor oxidoreductase subunit alpha [Planctomycetota bacterium]|nr:2-oxoacid:acceptor oxidoreductase subunit alpha [Planctomycetota bacterium]